METKAGVVISDKRARGGWQLKNNKGREPGTVPQLHGTDSIDHRQAMGGPRGAKVLDPQGEAENGTMRSNMGGAGAFRYLVHRLCMAPDRGWPELAIRKSES
jgi:hypothetical protein